jgi:hypothetical protein
MKKKSMDGAKHGTVIKTRKTKNKQMGKFTEQAKQALKQSKKRRKARSLRVEAALISLCGWAALWSCGGNSQRSNHDGCHRRFTLMSCLWQPIHRENMVEVEPADEEQKVQRLLADPDAVKFDLPLQPTSPNWISLVSDSITIPFSIVQRPSVT